MMATGGAALRSIRPWLSAPSVATSWSCTIFTTIWPGVTDFITSTPTASFFTPSTKRARHIERDVGLEQRTAHLAQCGVDIGFARARRGG